MDNNYVRSSGVRIGTLDLCPFSSFIVLDLSLMHSLLLYFVAQFTSHFPSLNLKIHVAMNIWYMEIWTIATRSSP